MNVYVDNQIRITDATPETIQYFRQRLTFDNPEYYKKVALGKWTGNTQKELSLMVRDGADIIIPFGMLPEIFARRSMFSSIAHKPYNAPHSVSCGSGISLYPYQEKAVEAALNARQGVLVAPCGSGKTQMGLEIAARLGMKTLWLTHTGDLLHQSMERAKANFNLEKADYGTITGGKVDIGEVITFATVQTMSKLDLSHYWDTWDVIITDECHHVCGGPTKVMMFYKVISNLSARYKYGLTATPKRADGLTPCMYALIGPKCYEVDRACVKETTCPVQVKVRKTDFVPDLDRILLPNGTLSWPDFVDCVTEDESRNKLIVGDVCEAGGTSLILTDRIKHIQTLRKMLEANGVSVVTLSASNTKKEKEIRKNAILSLTSGSVRCMIATYQLAKEGLDVPSLDNIFFAMPQKNESVITQAAGRVARKADGKAIGTVYDYQDNFSMLVSWQKKRNRIYKKLDLTFWRYEQ